MKTSPLIIFNPFLDARILECILRQVRFFGFHRRAKFWVLREILPKNEYKQQ